MVKTITAVYGSSGAVRNVLDDLISEGIPNEKFYADFETKTVKVIIPSEIEPEIREILQRHDPVEVR